MTTITKERLLTIKQWRETYGPGSNVVLPAEEAEELARIALASLEAKPIGAFHIAEQQVDGTSDYIKDGEWPIDNGTIEVYAAPPAPVVPEAEPVAWTDEEELRDVKQYGLGEIFQYPPDKYADSRRVIPLYRVPPASIVQAQGIEIAINELVALSPRLDKQAVETLSMAVEHLRKLVKKQLQTKD
ncbi:TPA: hypothetical protein J1W38_003266 [Escherichia coli]|nr:hypothetical protein [Escherichia coli]HBA6908429.1 hypothetical protein [Escherichia coli]